MNIGQEMKFSPDHSGQLGFLVTFSSNAVTMKEQTLIYPFESFLAEFGGCLGLFIGISFLSLWDIGVEIYTLASRYCKGSELEKEEEHVHKKRRHKHRHVDESKSVTENVWAIAGAGPPTKFYR